MGFACARALAPRGALLLVDVRAARLVEAAEKLAADGARCEVIAGDLCDSGVIRAIASGTAGLGGCAALVHSAGLSPTMGDASRIFAVNLVASAQLVAALEALLLPGAAGVLFASQAAHLAARGVSARVDALLDTPLAPDFYAQLVAATGALASSPAGAYALSKRGVQRLAVARAPAWGARGARLVSLSPGIVDTEMGAQEMAAHSAAMQAIVAATPAGARMGRADEIASVVGFLCSEAAGFVSGIDLLVDGGSTHQILRGAQ